MEMASISTKTEMSTRVSGGKITVMELVLCIITMELHTEVLGKKESSKAVGCSNSVTEIVTMESGSMANFMVEA